MEESAKQKALYDMLYLTACGIAGKTPDSERLAHMEQADVFAVSRKHFLNAVTYYAVESAGTFSGETAEKWRESRDKAIRKNMLLDAERAQLEAFMESSGISYMPLKGVYLKELYPGAGMRQMSDNDILFDVKYRSAVRDWFVSREYEVKSYEKGVHDVYLKKPVYNFELHTDLFSELTEFYGYYSNVRERLIPDSGSSFGCHFTDEDFYLYITSHSFKHYKNNGTGLRSLLDTYVFITAKGESLDWDYIEKEAVKIGIADYEKHCRELSRKVFASPETFAPQQLTDEELEMLGSFLNFGAYGSIGNYVSNQLEQREKNNVKHPKLDYIRTRLFLDEQVMKKYYPFFYKHKLLRPFVYVYRLYRAATVSRKYVLNELRQLMKK